jgi:hypothetical protein
MQKIVSGIDCEYGPGPKIRGRINHATTRARNNPLLWLRFRLFYFCLNTVDFRFSVLRLRGIRANQGTDHEQSR